MLLDVKVNPTTIIKKDKNIFKNLLIINPPKTNKFVMGVILSQNIHFVKLN